MLRATPGQAVHIDLGDGSALEGNAQDGRDGHDCVLLWDDASQVCGGLGTRWAISNLTDVCNISD